MKTRRQFLVMTAGVGVALTMRVPAMAAADSTSAATMTFQKSTAITEVFGEGIRLVGIAVQYNQLIESTELSPEDFSVENRTITDVFTSTSADPADKNPTGAYVIIMLSPDDKNALLAQKQSAPAANPGEKNDPASSKGGPGNAGDIPVYDTVYPAPKATFEQTKIFRDKTGAAMPRIAKTTTQQVKNLVVDNFKQYEFHDPKTGRSLKYNLFIPAHYSPSTAWPLVLFMHDAGATSDVTKTTLYQGLGAICWASPADQADRPCFVLAPQYEEIIADDNSQTSTMLETTVNLIHHLGEQYTIDAKRLYTTGQSGGCMMSIAMDIKYPDLFAASFLVAGQWDPARVKPLARQKLWVIVSQDDDKAWPGQNAIMEVLEKEGAHIARAEWDGTWRAQQFRQAFTAIDKQHAAINYISLRKGTVVPKGESMAGASGHRNTWRIAYTLEPVREWIFRQHK